MAGASGDALSSLRSAMTQANVDVANVDVANVDEPSIGRLSTCLLIWTSR
jgi:hypothetical protein